MRIGKGVVAALIVAATLAPTAADAHSVRGRCPQYEAALRRHGLPVRFFSRVMWRESRCQPQARNVNRNGSVDRGLLQINSIHLHPTRGVAKAYAGNPAALFNPDVNLAVAARLYRASGLRPWRATA